MTTDHYLKTAVQAARAAGSIFKKNFGRAKHIKAKGGNPRNLVTATDLQIEQDIKQLINKKFPSHNFLGEESGWQDSNRHAYNWIIDPIDGTSNYIQGIPMCCVSIALWDKSGPLIAVVYNPITEQMFTAMRGKGTRLNGKKVTVSKVATPEGGLGGLGWSLKIPEAIKMFAKILPEIRKVRALGTTALQLAYVASGTYDFYITNDMHVWDIAAGVLLVQEAGGKITDWKGSKPDYEIRDIVGSNGKLHKKLLQKVKSL